MGTSPLPPLYDRWLVEVTGAELEGEPGATCLDCAMVEVGPALAGFDPTTKCCTYTPVVPNYLVGAALADARLDEVGGRDSLRARIARRRGVTPLGLERDELEALLYVRAAPQTFGRAPSQRCPHYHASTGKCGVWLYRNAVCSTWFCKYERGRTGELFFQALRDLLMHVELELTRWCVLELWAPYRVVPYAQPDRPAPQLGVGALEGTVTDADYRRTWGAWIGREVELYAESARLVGALAWADVVRICGPELGLRVAALEAARQRRDRRFVPTALVLRRLEIARHGDPLLLGTYSSYDPLAVPPVLLRVLPVFRGQPVSEAREELAREADIEVSDELLERLVDFGVLADADPA